MAKQLYSSKKWASWPCDRYIQVNVNNFNQEMDSHNIQPIFAAMIFSWNQNMRSIATCAETVLVLRITGVRITDIRLYWLWSIPTTNPFNTCSRRQVPLSLRHQLVYKCWISNFLVTYGPLTYLVTLADGRVHHRHVDHIWCQTCDSTANEVGMDMLHLFWILELVTVPYPISI